VPAKDFIDLLPQQFPELKDIPIREAQVILLCSAGIEKTTVAEAMDISRQTVYDILKRHKVMDMIKGGINLQSMLTRAQVGTIMVEAASELMNKRGELKKMNASQLLNVVSRCAATISQIKVEVDERRPSEVSNPFEDLKKAVLERSPVEVIETDVTGSVGDIENDPA
jgi:DNA-binding XRE family transcriptional regulator